MQNPQQMLTGDPTTEARAQSGCLQGGLPALLGAWILAVTVTALVSTWLLEQAMLEGSFEVLDVRWLIILIYGLVVIVPSVVLWLAARGLAVRRYYLALALAGSFALLQAPTRLLPITAAVQVAAVQVAFTVLYLLLEWIITRKMTVPVNRDRKGIGLAFLVGGLLALPWLIWGALGSIWNTLLSLLLALLFGLASSRLLLRIFWHPAGTQNRFLRGAGAFLLLFVMVTGLAINGNQMLLVAAVPVLGWALAGLASSSSVGEGQKHAVNQAAVMLLVALAIFWPMAFFDPDELAAALTFSLMELFQSSALSELLAFLIGLVITLGLGLAGSRLVRLARGVFTTAAALIWTAAVLMFFVVGQPGFYGDRLYVILKDQADLSPAAEIDAPAARRMYVYQTLVAHANTTQAALRVSLDRWGIDYKPYYLENALRVDGGPLLRMWLEARPEVARVVDNPVLRPLQSDPLQSTGSLDLPPGVPWNITMIGADRAWQELGVTGKGIIIGQSDSGVQADHPELADSFRGRDSGADYNWLDPWYGRPEPYDFGGHGTHTLGTILGNQVGVAPDAEWIGCVNLARNLGSPSLYLDCMQFTFAPYPRSGDPFVDGRPELGAHITNNSWGCPEIEGCDPYTLAAAAAALRAAGVFVVSSAGNDGYSGCQSVKTPIALFDQVFSVGAVDQQGALAPFSSLGPVAVDGSSRMKPDIVAPGVDVVSAYPGSTYYAASGTSMAGPHVAGVVALMWSANPALIGDIDRTEQILDETAAAYTGPLPDCVTPGTPNNAVGYGVIDAYQAVRRALQP